MKCVSCLDKNTHMNKRTMGTKKEALAERYLVQKGICIVCRNYRVRQGEIDLIGWEMVQNPFTNKRERTLLFIEVKYRKNKNAGGALAAVTLAKQRQICRVSLFYLNHQNISPDTPIRYDVVAIEGDEITWVKNAFAFC